MIVDHREVLTGSFNWSENSELQSMENLIAIDDPDIAKAYSDRFAMKWDYGKGKLDPLIARIREAEGMGPCKFSPISLTAPQVEVLRKEYSEDACK